MRPACRRHPACRPGLGVLARVLKRSSPGWPSGTAGCRWTPFGCLCGMGLPSRCLSRLSITTSPVRAFTIATSKRSLDAAASPRMLSIVISKWTIAGFADAGRPDRRRVRDHPFVGVRRHVGRGLVDLAGLQVEGRIEEGGTRLVLRQGRRRLDLALHGTRVLGPRAVDEARLPDASGEQLLEVGEGAVRVRGRTRPRARIFAAREPGLA